jgi:hypothetical protein
MPVTVMLDSPELVRLIFCAALVLPNAWLAKVRDVGITVACGAAAETPVPDRLMVRGLPGALSAITIVPARKPVVVGLNTILMLQEVSAAMDPVQPLVIVKSLAGGVTLVMLTEPLLWL